MAFPLAVVLGCALVMLVLWLSASRLPSATLLGGALIRRAIR